MIFEKAKKIEKGMMISTIFTLILGLILAVAPETSVSVMTSIIGISFMIFGVFMIIDYFRSSSEEKLMSFSLVLGIIILAIGLFIFVRNTLLVEIFTVAIGLILCVKALYKVQFAVNLRTISNKWKLNLLAGLLILTLGVILIINPFESALTFLRIVGVILIIGSILELLESLSNIKVLNDAKDLKFIEKKDKE